MTTFRLPKPFTAPELRALHAAADRPELVAAMVLLEETGLRIAEFAAITTEEASSWPDPPWWTRLRRDRWYAPMHVIGKGDKERVVMLSARAVRASRVLLASTANGHLLPWTDRWLRMLIERAGDRAGVDAWPHRYRHSYASQLVEAGVAIQTVADMMGHESIDTTRLYFLMSQRAKSAAMRRRGRWLRRSRVGRASPQ